MVLLLDNVVRCDDDEVDIATEVPVVAPMAGMVCDGAIVDGGGGGGGIRHPAEVGGILAIVSPHLSSSPA